MANLQQTIDAVNFYLEPKGLQFAATIDPDLMRKQFDVATNENQIVVKGHSVAEVGSAAAKVLFDLGYRFISPQNRIEQAALDIGRVQTGPQTANYRARIFHQYGNDRRFDWGDKLNDEYLRWAIVNGVDCRTESAGHAWKHIKSQMVNFGMPADELFYEETPGVPLLRLDHPNVAELVAEERARTLGLQKQTNPDAYMISLEPSDGAAVDPVQYFEFVNDVAERIEQLVPGAWVSTYAYAAHRLPVLQLRENVMVQVTDGFNRTGLTFEQIIERWFSYCETISIRDYLNSRSWHHGFPGRNAKANDIERIDETLVLMRQFNIDVWTAETTEDWITNGIGTAYLVQSFINGSADLETVVHEFGEAFGFDAAQFAHVTLDNPPTTDYVFADVFGTLDNAPEIIKAWAVQTYQRWKLAENHATRDWLSAERWPAVEKYLRNSVWIGPHGLDHVYAGWRRDTNGNFSGSEHRVTNNPPPAWTESPLPIEPIEFEETKADLDALPPAFDAKLANYSLAATGEPNEGDVSGVEIRDNFILIAVGEVAFSVDDWFCDVPGVYHIQKTSIVRFLSSNLPGSLAVVASARNPAWFDYPQGLWIHINETIKTGAGTGRLSLKNADKPKIDISGSGTFEPSGPVQVHRNTRGRVVLENEVPLVQFRRDFKIVVG